MEPVGIFGGTFDPVHFGHLRTAYEILNEFDLAQMRFVPCGTPHDGKSPVAAAELRLRMVREAVASEPGFVVDEREVGRAGPSYSIDTLESLRQEFPDRSFALVIGMDAFRGFTTWHRWEAILEAAHVIIARRPGAQAPSGKRINALLSQRASKAPGDLRAQPAGLISVHTVTQLEISSSAIREMVRRGASAEFLLPDAVQEIIDATGCYV